MGKQTSVLVIDDDQKVFDSVKEILGAEDYFLMYSSSVKDAKDKIRFYDFDIILLDLILPEASGLDILEYIQLFMQHKPQLVLMTSYSAPEMETMAIQMGAVACVFKPLDKEKLETAFKSYFEKNRQ